MALTPETIQKLIDLDKLEEAVKAIIELSDRLNASLRASALALAGEYTDFKFNSGTPGVDSMQLKQAFRLKLVNFVLELKKDPTINEEIKIIETKYLFRENKLPFVDRKGFRELICQLTKSKGAEVVFVNGTDKSGMTYLENYLSQLSKTYRNIDLIRINAAAEFDGPSGSQGLKLTQFLSVKMQLNLIQEGINDDQLKFEIFVTRLKEKLEESNQIRIIFIHDFHKLADITEDLRRFIYKLIDNFKQEYPQLVFILAGFKYTELTNWATDLQTLCHIYQIEAVEDEHIADCLEEIYDLYSDKLEQKTGSKIEKEMYKQQMLPIIKGNDTPINIAHAGLKLMEHLTFLNQA
jgi:hypothetical protein